MAKEVEMQNETVIGILKYAAIRIPTARQQVSLMIIKLSNFMLGSYENNYLKYSSCLNVS